MITEDILLAIAPKADGVADKFVLPLNEACARFEIDTRARQAAFLAQAAFESREFTALAEDLNYRAERLLAVFPSHFSLYDIYDYEHQPEQIANRAYANRLGNGDESSGDGWAYRGRGIFQLTGRANYRDCSIHICGDADTLLLNPELLEAPEYASLSAAWFWNEHELNVMADAGAFATITKRINGGMGGYPVRLMYWDRAIQALA